MAAWTDIREWMAGGNARDLGSRPWPVAIWTLSLFGSIGGFLWTDARPVLWSSAFGVAGALCLVNGLRSGRLHCLFTGPIFLAGTALVALRWSGRIAVAWNWIGVGVLGLVAAALLLELVLGKTRVGGQCC